MLNLCSIGGVGIAQFVTGRIYAAHTPAEWDAMPFVIIFWFFAACLGVGIAIYLCAKDTKPDST